MTTVPLQCAKCSALNSPQNRFCGSCGAALSSIPLTQTTQPVVPPGQGIHASTGSLPPNTVLKQQYIILDLLGQGGMGAVYKAADTQWGKNQALRAVKEMGFEEFRSQSGYLDPSAITKASEAFKQEAFMLASLQHPNLPRIYDYFNELNRWYLVMDYIEGSNLNQYLQDSGGILSIQDVLAIGIQLCTVLDYLHTRQPPIVFRDLKPTNIMRTREGHLYLIDFGIARHFKVGQTRDTGLFVSAGYAAPEQYGHTQTTPQSDIYSLGATLHQLISGKNPLNNKPTLWNFAPLSLSGPPTAAGLGHLIARMLAMNPADRPASIATVKQELQRIAAGQPLAIVQSPQSPGGTSQAGGPGPIIHPAPPLGTTLCQYTGHTDLVCSLSWSSDGSRIVSVGADGTAHVWDASTGKTLLIYQGHLHTPQQPGGWGQPVDPWAQQQGYPGGWGPPPQAPQWQQAQWGPPQQPSVGTRVVTWSPNGQYVVSVGNDWTPQVWDASNGNLLFKYEGHTGAVYALAWAPDSTLIASGGADGTQIWQALRGRRRFTTPFSTVSGLAWSPDGANIAATSWYSSGPHERGSHYNKRSVYDIDISLHVWKATNGEAYMREGFEISVNSTFTKNSLDNGFTSPVVWSPDGAYFAYGGGATYSGESEEVAAVDIYKWAPPRQCERTFSYKGHISPISALAWSPNGQRIASAGEDRCVLVWDALTGLNVDTWRGSAPISAVAWSPDSQQLAASLDGKTIQVWQAE